MFLSNYVIILDERKNIVQTYIVNMSLMNDLMKMNKWIKILFGVAVLVILWTLVWPRSTHYVPANPYIENMDNQMQPTFAMFYAPWCGYCKKMMPDWDNLASSYNGQAQLMKINCDEQKDLARKHGVKSFPTIKLLLGGLDDTSNVKEEFIGEVATSTLENFSFTE